MTASSCENFFLAAGINMSLEWSVWLRGTTDCAVGRLPGLSVAIVAKEPASKRVREIAKLLNQFIPILSTPPTRRVC